MDDLDGVSVFLACLYALAYRISILMIIIAIINSINYHL